MMHYTFLCCP